MAKKKVKRPDYQRAKNWNSFSGKEVDDHAAAMYVLNGMRNGLTFDVAYQDAKQHYGKAAPSKAFVKDTIKPALTIGTVRNENGRFVRRTIAAKTDNLVRRITVVNDATGKVETIEVRGSKAADRINAYWWAVRNWTQHGKWQELANFSGKSIKTTDGRTITLLTDESVLDQLANTGELTDIIVSGR